MFIARRDPHDLLVVGMSLIMKLDQPTHCINAIHVTVSLPGAIYLPLTTTCLSLVQQRP